MEAPPARAPTQHALQNSPKKLGKIKKSWKNKIFDFLNI
jgi:hypothetical protein